MNFVGCTSECVYLGLYLICYFLYIRVAAHRSMMYYMRARQSPFGLCDQSEKVCIMRCDGVMWNGNNRLRVKLEKNILFFMLSNV